MPHKPGLPGKRDFVLQALRAWGASVASRTLNGVLRLVQH